MKKCFIPILTLLLIGCGFEAKAQSAALTRFLETPALKHAAISFQAVDLASGQAIASYREEKCLIPASALKVITTATALEQLGADFRYPTRLLTDGEIDAHGLLDGSLYIEGSGDPTMGSEFLPGDKEAFLKQWSDDLRKAGIKKVSGDIVAMDQLFGYEGVSPFWLWEDLGNYFASGTYGLSIYDNTYRLYLRSGAAGTKTTVLRSDPDIPGLRFLNEVVAAANTKDSAYIYGIPFSPDRRVYGTIPQNQSSFMIKGDIPDPGLLLAQHVKAQLTLAGIRIEGEATSYRLSQRRPRSPRELSVWLSPSLEQIIRVVNVRSNNHYAEHLYRTLQQEGIDIPTFWSRRRIDSGGLRLKDGNGLSPMNTVSASFLTKVLTYMYRSPHSVAFRNSFPLAGREGTVAAFLKGTPLEGRARIKSGSIDGVQSYAGYLEKDGRSYAFAILVNNFSGSRATLRKEIEQLLLNF